MTNQWEQFSCGNSYPNGIKNHSKPDNQQHRRAKSQPASFQRGRQWSHDAGRNGSFERKGDPHFSMKVNWQQKDRGDSYEPVPSDEDEGDDEVAIEPVSSRLKPKRPLLHWEPPNRRIPGGVARKATCPRPTPDNSVNYQDWRDGTTSQCKMMSWAPPV